MDGVREVDLGRVGDMNMIKTHIRFKSQRTNKNYKIKNKWFKFYIYYKPVFCFMDCVFTTNFYMVDNVYFSSLKGKRYYNKLKYIIYIGFAQFIHWY